MEESDPLIGSAHGSGASTGGEVLLGIIVGVAVGGDVAVGVRVAVAIKATEVS